MEKKPSRFWRLLQCCWRTTSESRMQRRVLLKVTVYRLRVAMDMEESKRMMILENKILYQSQGVKR